MVDKTDFNSARALAERLISKSGEPASFVKSGSTGGYDEYGDPLPDQPDIVIDGIVTPLFSFKTNEVDNENILASDSYVFFHSETAPEVGFEHTQNGKTYRMVSMMKEMTSVDGINVFRRIQLRR